MQLLDIIGYFGRFHPLVVHLPIGFLLLVVILDLLGYAPRFEWMKKLLPFLLLLGFLSAALASVLGFMLADGGDYEPDLLDSHKISGIALTVLSALLYLACHPRIGKKLRIRPKLFSVMSILMLAVLSYAGHQGGSLTHGSDYLSLAAWQKSQRPKPASVAEAMVFQDVILPLMEKKCAQCHNRSKLKGKLSVEGMPQLLKGGENGPAVVPGESGKSELYRRVTLDPGHKEYMPTDGKPPLTTGEVQILQWWINQAKASDAQNIEELSAPDSIRTHIAAFLQLDGGSLLTFGAVNPAIPATTDSMSVISLRKKGVKIRVMLHQPAMLDVTVPPASRINMADIQQEITAIAKNIIWLNLSENELTAAQLDFLPALSNLEKLRLDKTKVGDDIHPLFKDLAFLEALNLNETAVTPEGLDLIRKHSSIKRIYHWKPGAPEQEPVQEESR